MTKLDASGAALAYSTYLGGSSDDHGGGIAVDGAGSAYVTGWTDSADFPTTPGAFDTTYNGGRRRLRDEARRERRGARLLDLSRWERRRGWLRHRGRRRGNAYVPGHRLSDFPTTPGAFDTTFNGGYDAFVTKLDLGGPRHHLTTPTPAATTSSSSSATASTAATASASAATATSATAPAPATASTSAATPAPTAAFCRPVRGAEGDRPDASEGPHADPCEALLRRSHPPCSLQASGPRDRPEPEAGEGGSHAAAG